jgi:RND family efflux transporter MFP subunit
MRALLILIIGASAGAAGVWYAMVRPAGAPSAANETLYTCPMHPQILQDEPGTCPICGMDLVVKQAGRSGGAASQATASQPAASQPAAKAYTCPMHPQISEAEPGECPICGMDLIEAAPGSQPAASQPAASQPAHQHTHPTPGADTYTCPMHPQIVQDEPGTCPICGMDLVKRAATAGGPEVTIDPVTIQNMGVRLATAQLGGVRRAVRTVGTVVVPEDELTVVNLRYAGWIERLRVAETGAAVSKGDVLFDVYSPELLAAQEEYAVARRTAGPKSALAEAARRRLTLYDAGGLARRIDKGRKPLTRIAVRAPATGFVLHLNVVEGGRVAAGKDLYRIADLSHVWVEAEVYAHDAPYIRKGAPAQVRFETGEPLDAIVDYVYPTLDPRTRTLRVRLEIPNPTATLRPGAIATVSIAAQEEAQTLVIPTAAIIHSGTRQLVFVARGDGRFAPREIQTGLVGDDGTVQVRSGLDPGQQVVTSGQFLIDSESQLQEAIQKMLDR